LTEKDDPINININTLAGRDINAERDIEVAVNQLSQQRWAELSEDQQQSVLDAARNMLNAAMTDIERWVPAAVKYPEEKFYKTVDITVRCIIASVNELTTNPTGDASA
jgi:hypothetical protein